ncbi:hypothetical protein LCGC14_2064540 [marine sediment metagenome]|uniref:Aminoglycoside phosphotransferase domain-containing protein n=1 Tax=marine sediment metagenome TaxID=412755 RepID=A0A0F9GYP2_9ZZZZ
MKKTSCQDNHMLHKKLSELVDNNYIAERGIQGNVSYGKLVVEDFSSHFWVDAEDSSVKRGVYVKIPKASIKKRNVMPISEGDIKLAEEEYKSLVYLSRFWDSNDINVKFIRPLDYIRAFNAIVTERAYAGDILAVFRRFDGRRKLRAGGHSDLMNGYLFRIGTALSRFHNRSVSKEKDTLDEVVGKVEHYLSQLEPLLIKHALLNRIRAMFVEHRNKEISCHKTTNLKGLDIRNVLVDRSHRIFLLDPGRIKVDFKEADLARFLVTCKILYWGSLQFFLGYTPHPSYKRSFLHGYFNKDKRLDDILLLMIIKELLKHWCMAHTALELKRWPAPFKRFLEVTFINSFYERQLENELIKLGV